MLKTTRVFLRDSRIEDLDYILQIEKDASQTGFVNHWSREKHEEAQLNALTDHLIIETMDGTSVGYLIGNQNPDDNYELMRIVISKRGNSYGKEAIEALIKHAFKLTTHRFWLDVRSHNHKAVTLYESMGFVTEGILREAVKFQDSYVSVQVMSILRREYEV